MRRLFLLQPFLLVFTQLAAVQAQPPRPELALQDGHSRQIMALAASKTGLVASLGYEQNVKIWEASSGDLLRTIQGPPDEFAWNVAFSPDGSTIAVLQSTPLKKQTGVRLYSARSGKLTAFIPDQTFSPTPQVFSPDGKMLAIGSGDSNVNLWNAQTGKLAQSLKGLTKPAESLAFTPNGEKLLGLSVADQALCEWDVASGTLLRKIKIQSGKTTCLALSPDGTWAAWGISTNEQKPATSVALYDIKAEKFVHTFNLEPGRAEKLVFSPDGKALAIIGNGAIHLWNTQTGAYSATVQIAADQSHTSFLNVNRPSALRCAAFLPDGKTLATGSDAGGVSFYAVAQPEKPRLIRAMQGSNILMRSLAFSPDGSTLTSEQQVLPKAVVTYQVWDARTGTLQKTLLQQAGARLPATAESPGAVPEPRKVLATLKESKNATNLVFINEGKAIVGSIGPVLRLWDKASGAVLRNLTEHQGNIAKITVSPDGRSLVSADYVGTIRVWNTKADQLEARHEMKLGLKYQAMPTNYQLVHKLVFSSDNKTFAGVFDTHVLLFDATRGTLNHSIEITNGSATAVAFAPEGRRLAIGSNGAIRFWECQSGRLLVTLFGLPGELFSYQRAFFNKKLQSGIDEESKASLAFTPEGYYSGSAVADRYVKFRLSEALFPAESFQARYYRPDLVQKALAGGELPPIGTFRGPFPPVAKLGLAPTDKSLPNSVLVSLAATDDSEVQKIAFFINGARVEAALNIAESRPLTSEARALTADAKALTSEARPLTADSRNIPDAHRFLRRYTATLPLPQGVTEIKVQAIAFDDDGLQSPREELLFTRAGVAPATGRLLGLCVGISQYQDARLNLKFADADANALSQVLGTQRGIYSEAKVSALTNENATSGKIKGALDTLIQNCTVTDTVIFSLSGHGWRDDGRNFYFASHEVDRANIAGTALPWAEITARLTQLSQKTRRVIVFLDACHSGSAATNEELVKSTLASNAGVLIFASSRGNQVSLENAEWGHGAFTKALLEAINGKAAPEDGKTTIIDFIAYVSRRVKTLTQEQQSPQVPFLQDFDSDSLLVGKLN